MTTQTTVPDGSPKLSRRKAPRQQRARLTVKSILQATEALVIERGFSNVGTRLIAERAGVSIGSLYQYFPTYESILLAWYEDVASQVAQKARLAMMRVVHEDLRVSVPYAMKVLLDELERQELVLVRMVKEVPEIEQSTSVASFEGLIRASMRIYFNQHHEFHAKDTERHVFFLENIIFSNVRRYLADRPLNLSRKDFLAHLSRVVIAYLDGDLTRQLR